MKLRTWFAGILSLSLLGTVTSVETAQMAENRSMEQVKHLTDFEVIEFRRYTIKEGEREHFAQISKAIFQRPSNSWEPSSSANFWSARITLYSVSYTHLRAHETSLHIV